MQGMKIIGPPKEKPPDSVSRSRAVSFSGSYLPDVKIVSAITHEVNRSCNWESQPEPQLRIEIAIRD
jgi:hypothetical protein